MKRIRFLILSIALVALVACTISVPSPQVTTRGATVHESGEFFEAELLVGYRDGLTAQDVANELNASILANWPMMFFYTKINFALYKIERLFPYSRIIAALNRFVQILKQL